MKIQKSQNKNITQASKNLQISEIVNHKRLSIWSLNKSQCSMTANSNVEGMLVRPGGRRRVWVTKMADSGA